jgi:hypothetical protein
MLLYMLLCDILLLQIYVECFFIAQNKNEAIWVTFGPNVNFRVYRKVFHALRLIVISPLILSRISKSVHRVHTECKI